MPFRLRATVPLPAAVQPSLMICLTGDAAAKYAHDVKAGGRLVLDSFSVQEVPNVDANVYQLPLIETARNKVGNEIVTNMVALGMVARVLELEGVMQPEAMRKAMLDRVPKGTEELNKKAFEEGYNMFKDAPAHI